MELMVCIQILVMVIVIYIVWCYSGGCGSSDSELAKLVCYIGVVE
jgi:hypothetical protein